MKQEEILFFLGSACIVVFAWIAFTVLHNSLTSTIGSTTAQAISPIQPTFNTKIIDAMRSRSTIVPLNIIPTQSPTNIVVTTAPQPTVPVATQSASTATTGGTLQ